MSFTAVLPETPQRALPGSFFNTPAASRFPNVPQQPIFAQTLDARRRQSTVAASGKADQVAPVATQQRQSLPPIQRAARTVNEVLQREAGFPELDSYVRQGTSSDYELPGSSTEAPWAPFAPSRMFDIPDAIFEQYNRAEVSTMMGLFADLNHAWITIDNALYLWDYTNPNPEIKGYEDQSNTITAVQLVVPKPGVFVAQVNYMLVVATTAEIQLLGLSAASDEKGTVNVQIYQTKLAQGTRGLNVQHIAGSNATGRIFFSSDNDVHEIVYHAEERWFKNRTGLTQHTGSSYTAILPLAGLWSNKAQPERVEDMIVDDSRRLLYTLSNESTIRTFYFGGAIDAFQPAVEKKRQEFLRDISHMLSNNPLLPPSMQIVSISPISAQEGSKLHLTAITSTGVRLFLSATRGYGYSSGNAGAPQSMQVQHVRFPPRIEDAPSQAMVSGQQNGEQPLDTSSTALVTSRMGVRFPPGFFFCFVEKSDSPGRDSLFLSSPDTGRIAAQYRDPSTQQWKYYEQGCWHALNSKAEAVGLVTKPFSAANQPTGFGNELAEQFDQPPTEVAILTNTGVHLIRRRRLVDVFAAAIRKGGNDEGLDAEVKKFIRQYGRGETAATALAVACGQGCDIAQGGNVVRISDPDTLELARKTFVEYGGRPSLNENSVADGQQPAIDSVRPSSRHEGLSLYIGRLVRSIWKQPIIAQVTSPQGLQIMSTVNRNKLSTIQEELIKLQQFLEKNKTFIEGLAGPDSLQRVSSQQEQIAIQGEHQALHSLQKLISNIIEGISFAQMLFDEQVERVFMALDDRTRQDLRDLTYELLFASDIGRDVAKTLVKAIVNRNIENGSNVDTVAEALRRRCGSFCSADDVIIFKAQEQLKKASEVGGSSDRGRNLLNESLRLFKQVAGSLSFENLQAAVNEFAQLQFFAGAFSLALVVAREYDRGNRALSWVKEGKPLPDSREAYYVFRRRCYDIVFRTIDSMREFFKNEPEMIDGRLTRSATIQQEANDQVNESDDELFHFELYSWYLENQEIDRLLAVDSPFVADFLSKSAENQLQHADLLWQYHARREQFYEAATVQLNLAKSTHDISLARRMEYLSRAKANASSPTTGVGRQTRQVLLYEITELLDVANIQDELLTKLKSDPRSEGRDDIAKPLSGQIVDLTILFNDYADAAGYHDISLLIYEAADHRNEADIAAAWEALIEATHLRVINDDNASQMPYEAVVTEIKEMSHRLNGSENTFNPQMLIPLIERYALEHQREVNADRWIPDLFITVGFPYEASIAVIQQLWYGNVTPFTGQGNRVLASHIVYLVDRWFEDCLGRNERPFGGEENAREIVLLLGAVAGGVNGLSSADKLFVEDVRRRIGRSFR